VTAKIILFTRYEMPELRMVKRFGGFYSKDPEQRAIHVDAKVEWWSDDQSPSVSVKGWCQRVKKDGSDSAHAPTDVWDASSWLSPKDWKTITLRLMVDVAALTPPQEVLVDIEQALAKYEAKCTWGQDV